MKPSREIGWVRFEGSTGFWSVLVTAIAWTALVVESGLGVVSGAGLDGPNCVECHVKSNPVMVQAWQGSRHAAKGVGCAACHGENHSAMFAVKGQVSAAVCGSCHEQQVKEFARSLHASAVDTMEADPRFARLSPVMKELGCLGCHKIGQKYPDGSRGNCSSCHSSHAFSSVEARQPAACAGCHSGPDHPQMEAWQASKHGQLYMSEATRLQAPTCVTCHMPKGTHETGVGLTLGTVANGAVHEPDKAILKMRTISAEEAERQRSRMVDTCSPCHSSRFSTENLSKADLVKQEADQLLGEGLELVQQLKRDGFLPELSFGPSMGRTNTGAVFRRGSEVSPGPGEVYDQLRPIERWFFEMAKFHHPTTFKGAYHQSSMHTHNLGFLRLRQGLDAVRQEADEIRKTRVHDRSQPPTKDP